MIFVLLHYSSLKPKQTSPSPGICETPRLLPSIRPAGSPPPELHFGVIHLLYINDRVLNDRMRHELARNLHQYWGRGHDVLLSPYVA